MRAWTAAEAGARPRSRACVSQPGRLCGTGDRAGLACAASGAANDEITMPRELAAATIVRRRTGRRRGVAILFAQRLGFPMSDPLSANAPVPSHATGSAPRAQPAGRRGSAQPSTHMPAERFRRHGRVGGTLQLGERKVTPIAAGEPPPEVNERHRPGEPVPLRDVAAALAELIADLGGLDALRYDDQAQIVAKFHD